jgi:rifampin ADP-ribosylating transferase
MSEENTAMGENSSTHVPVTYERCARIDGPFYHGTKSALEAGDELVPGYGSNFQQGRMSNNIYFTALVDTAVWGAELASMLAGSGERGAGSGDTFMSLSPWVRSKTTRM